MNIEVVHIEESRILHSANSCDFRNRNHQKFYQDNKLLVNCEKLSLPTHSAADKW